MGTNADTPEACNTPEARNTPEADEIEEKSNHSDSEGSEDETDSHGHGVSNTSHKSEYSRIREANIAQNKELLIQLGLQFGLGGKEKNIPRKKGKKATPAPKTRTIGEGSHMSKSDSTSTTTTSKITGSILTNDTSANGTDDLGKSEEHHQASELTVSTLNNDSSAIDLAGSQKHHQATELTASSFTHDSSTNGTNDSDASQEQASTLTNESFKKGTSGTNDLAASKEHASTLTYGSSSNGPNDSAASQEHPSTPTNDSSANGTNDSSASQEHASTHTNDSSANGTNDSTMMDVVSPASATSNAGPMEVVQEQTPMEVDQILLGHRTYSSHGFGKCLMLISYNDSPTHIQECMYGLVFQY